MNITKYITITMKNLKLLCTLTGIILFSKAWSSTPVDTDITFNNVKHKLNLSIPSSYDAQKKYPLVISLHWCPGAQVEGYAKDFRNAFAKFSDSLQVIVACPDNTGNAISDDDIGILKATVDSVKELYNINENEVFLTGMSCNGYVTVRQGLKKVYPFKGVFAWDPWIQSINAGEFDYNSKMPIILAIGTMDQNYTTILNLYDSLKFHNANVNLVIVKNVGHELTFSSFTDNMVRCFKYLNDTNSISINKVNDFELDDNDTTDITISVNNKTGKKMTYRAISSKTTVMSDPKIVEQEGTNIKITLIPKIGKTGITKIVFEAGENDGLGMEQIIFNVKVIKATAIKSVSSRDKLFIYPNPADHILNINNTMNLSKIEITDLYGRQMICVSNPGQCHQLDISNLKSGIYFLKAEGENYWETKQFVIR
jgi:hypothetical protein